MLLGLQQECPTYRPAQTILRTPLTPHHHGGGSCNAAQPSPRHAPISQQQLHISGLLTLPWLKPGHGEGSVQCQLKLWQISTHFDTLVKHCSVSREKYAAMLSVLIKEFENRFQDCRKKSSIFLYLWNSIFICHKYSFQTECIENIEGLWYSTQNSEHASIRDFCKTSLSR